MTKSVKLQLEEIKLYLEREKKRRKNIVERYKVILEKVNNNIELIKKRINLFQKLLREKSSKKISENKEGVFCVGCGKRIKQGKYCDECRIAVEKIRYQTSKEMWEKLPEEEKIKRMEKLSKSLLDKTQPVEVQER